MTEFSEPTPDAPAGTALPARDWTAYEPILATAFISALTVHILKATYGVPFLPVFMGVWLLQFSMVKIFDLQDFAAQFGTYDIFTMRVPTYAFMFPFAQMALALAYLGRFALALTSAILIVLAFVNLVGLFQQIKKEADFKSRRYTGMARAPLRDAAIIENALMILMGLAYFLFHRYLTGAPAFTLPMP